MERRAPPTFNAGGCPPRRVPGLGGGGPSDWRALRGGTAVRVGFGIGAFAVCGFDGPVKTGGARAGSALTGIGMVMFDGAEGDDTGTDERRGMRDLRAAEVRPG